MVAFILMLSTPPICVAYIFNALYTKTILIAQFCPEAKKNKKKIVNDRDDHYFITSVLLMIFLRSVINLMFVFNCNAAVAYFFFTDFAAQIKF